MTSCHLSWNSRTKLPRCNIHRNIMLPKEDVRFVGFYLEDLFSIIDVEGGIMRWPYLI